MSNSKQALVTVIALCFNHEAYLLETLNSVLGQTYPFVELIIVDDCSTDRSAELIETFANENKKVQFIKLSENIGNCKAFNRALALAKGKYIMDLATDDILEPHCIENQVLTFENLPENYGVVFGNARLISEKGEFLRNFYQTDKIGKVQTKIPEGDIYSAILAHSFICTPTTLFRKKMLDELGGYDENLTYEDFDIWVRSSRNWHYGFIDKILLSKRSVANSLGEGFYLRKHNPHLLSTLKICEKAHLLNRNTHENKALAQRLRYHVRLSFYTENFETALLFSDLLKKTTKLSLSDQIWRFLVQNKIQVYNWYVLYRKYHKKAFL